MAESLIKMSNKAAELVRSIPPETTIRVVSHYDADGITAAAVICTALYRAGYDFHATLMRNPFTKGLERLAKEESELIIFSDMGSGQIQTLETFEKPLIIIDHHQIIKQKVRNEIIQINANLCGMDGNYEASGATLSYSFAIALDDDNIDLAPLALAGAIGDKQHIGGLRGYNKELVDMALKKELLHPRMGLKLSGTTLLDALYFSIDPYYSQLSGNKKQIEKLLDKLNIDTKTSVADLTSETLTQLHSILVFSLLKTGCQSNIVDTIIRTRYFAPTLGYELEQYADLLDACGKFGSRGVGLALCFGSKEAAIQAQKIEQDFDQKILSYLITLENGGIEEGKVLRYFYCDDSSLGGVVAGIAANYIFDETKPLLSLVKKEEENEIHVSCRGNQTLVVHGLDLAQAMKEASQHFGGFGGGHKIAAGATIPLDKEQEFIPFVDAVVTRQLKEYHEHHM